MGRIMIGMMVMPGIRVEMQGIRVRMRGIMVGMMRMRGIRVGVWGIGGGNKGNNGENLRIGVEMMNKKYGEAKIKRKCVHL